MTGSRVIGLPSGITRNLANTTTPIPRTATAATPRRVHASRHDQSNDKPLQIRDLTDPTPSWMTQRGAMKCTPYEAITTSGQPRAVRVARSPRTSRPALEASAVHAVPETSPESQKTAANLSRPHSVPKGEGEEFGDGRPTRPPPVACVHTGRLPSQVRALRRPMRPNGRVFVHGARAPAEHLTNVRVPALLLNTLPSPSGPARE